MGMWQLQHATCGCENPHNCVLLNTCLEIVNTYYSGVSKVSQILWCRVLEYYMKLVWQQELLTMHSKRRRMSLPARTAYRPLILSMHFPNKIWQL